MQEFWTKEHECIFPSMDSITYKYVSERKHQNWTLTFGCYDVKHNVLFEHYNQQRFSFTFYFTPNNLIFRANFNENMRRAYDVTLMTLFEIGSNRKQRSTSLSRLDGFKILKHWVYTCTPMSFSVYNPPLHLSKLQKS